MNEPIICLDLQSYKKKMTLIGFLRHSSKYSIESVGITCDNYNYKHILRENIEILSRYK